MRLPNSLTGFPGANALSQEDEVCAVKLDEKIAQAKSGARYPLFSQMLNDNQQAIARHILARYGFSDYLMWGGHPMAERKMLGLNLNEGEEYTFPLTLIKCTQSGDSTLTHRDYLGAVLALGIKRELVGDMLMLDAGEALLFVSDGIAKFVCENLMEVGNQKIKAQDASGEQLQTLLDRIRTDYELIKDTVASLRIDAVVAAVINCSRSEAQAFIKSEKVQINHLTIRDCDRETAQGALISVRGRGRYRLDEVGPPNKKNRLRIVIKKYI